MTRTRKESEWHIMAYFSGANDLADEMVWSIKEMRRCDVGPGRPVTVDVLYDPGWGLPTQRYVIEGPQRNGARLIEEARPFVYRGRERGNLDMGSPKWLRRFVRQSVQEFPAKHNMVILSGHGNGSENDFFLRDFENGNSLTIPELKNTNPDWDFKDAFSEVGAMLRENGRRIDILGMDSCQLSTAEVYFQLRGEIGYLVAAEGFELSSGWPYRRVIEALNRSPGQDPRKFARSIVRNYVSYYEDYAVAGHSVHLAACDIGNSDSLRDALTRLSDSLIYGLEDHRVKAVIEYSHFRCQSFNGDQFSDLCDFCQELHHGLSELNSREAKRLSEDCQGVIDALGEIVVDSCYAGPAYQYAQGLSIYFPWSYYSNRFSKLDLAKHTGWGAFTEAYVTKTRRPANGEDGKSRMRKQIYGNASRAAIRRRKSLVAASGLPAAGFRANWPDNKGGSSPASLKNPPQHWLPDGCA